jgi:hypothetical protein
MAVSGFGLIRGAVVMFVWRNRKQTAKVVSQAGLKTKVWTCFLLNMKVSATWMNIYLLSLKSVQSSNAAAKSPVLLQCSLHWVSVYVQLANLFVPITVFLYSPFFFIWLSHLHFILYNTFSKFLYSSISVQLAMFLVVISLLIFNQLLLQFFLCIFVLLLSSMTN